MLSNGELPEEKRDLPACPGNANKPYPEEGLRGGGGGGLTILIIGRDSRYLVALIHDSIPKRRLPEASG